MKTIWAIILTYNNREIIEDLCESLEKNTDYPLNLLFIDNASSDGTKDFLIEYCNYNSDFDMGEVRLIQNSRNLGVSAGWNQGIKFLDEYEKVDYFAFINSDIEVGRKWLSPMVEVLEENPTAGMVDNILKCQRMRHFIQSDGPLIGNPFHYNMSNQPEFKKNTHSKPVQWGTLACCLFKKEIFQKVGVFDEKMFIYSSDFDMQIRMKKAGWNVWHCPHSHAYHRAFYTCSRVRDTNPEIARKMTEDGVYLNKKWTSAEMKWFQNTIVGE